MKSSSKIMSTMVVVVMVLLTATPPALVQGADGSSNVPACATDFVKCAQNMNATEIEENPDNPIECCTIFADLVKNDEKCVCDNFVKALKAQNYDDILNNLFTVCGTNTTPDALCNGGSSGSGNSTGTSSSESTGSKSKLPNGANKITAFALLPSAVFLIWSLVF